MTTKNAFIGADGILKAWGYIEENEPGDTKIGVPEDFTLEPKKWRWDGASWQPVP